jgi:hypothetical protein
MKLDSALSVSIHMLEVVWVFRYFIAFPTDVGMVCMFARASVLSNSMPDLV